MEKENKELQKLNSTEQQLEELKESFENANFGIVESKQVNQVLVNVSFLDNLSAERNKYKDKAEQLESDKQKLIEKLEEDANKLIPLAEDMNWARCRKEYAKELLKVLRETHHE